VPRPTPWWLTSTPSPRPRRGSVEIRNAAEATVLKVAPNAAGEPQMVMSGHFATFNDWVTIHERDGRFLERISPGAFRQTFADRTPKVLFEHGKDPSIGSKPLGAILSLREDERGAAYRVALFDTSYTRDLFPGLQAGCLRSELPLPRHQRGLQRATRPQPPQPGRITRTDDPRRERH
jgi:Caudovirus prohead serine protease